MREVGLAPETRLQNRRAGSVRRERLLVACRQHLLVLCKFKIQDSRRCVILLLFISDQLRSHTDRSRAPLCVVHLSLHQGRRASGITELKLLKRMGRPVFRVPTPPDLLSFVFF